MWCARKGLASEEILNLRFFLELVGTRTLGVSTEELEELGMVPWLNIIVNCFHPMDDTFNRVPDTYVSLYSFQAWGDPQVGCGSTWGEFRINTLCC